MPRDRVSSGRLFEQPGTHFRVPVFGQRHRQTISVRIQSNQHRATPLVPGPVDLSRLQADSREDQ